MTASNKVPIMVNTVILMQTIDEYFDEDGIYMTYSLTRDECGQMYRGYRREIVECIQAFDTTELTNSFLFVKMEGDEPDFSSSFSLRELLLEYERKLKGE